MQMMMCRQFITTGMSDHDIRLIFSFKKASGHQDSKPFLQNKSFAHSEFTAQQTEDLNGFCLEHGLLQCGGSDYHGSRKPGIELGTGRGQLQVPEGYLKGWPEKMIRHVLQL